MPALSRVSLPLCSGDSETHALTHAGSSDPQEPQDLSQLIHWSRLYSGDAWPSGGSREGVGADPLGGSGGGRAWDALPRRATGLPVSPHSDVSKREDFLDQRSQQPTPEYFLSPVLL